MGSVTNERFPFGANWNRFIRTIDDRAVGEAAASLCSMLDVTDLGGVRMLDAGCGSGLAGLAARRLGATVHAFDYDRESVACARELRHRLRGEDADWSIESGSLLDPDYVRSLGRFDVVYCWGVLHHTGRMWDALATVAEAVADGGQLYVAIYNDQGWPSGYWRAVKRLYHRYRAGRWAMTAVHFPYLFLLRYTVRLVTGRHRLERGMSLWYDMVDWLGGLPFEVAKPADVIAFARSRGFHELKVRAVRGNRPGCNEFLFRRVA